jgi:hypothetical protein
MAEHVGLIPVTFSRLLGCSSGKKFAEFVVIAAKKDVQLISRINL